MSNWPTRSHYQTMMQKPQIALSDPALKQCEIAKDAKGQPLCFSGNFAIVFKATCPQTKQSVALRAFISAREDRLKHYNEVSNYLKMRNLRSLVGFQLYEKGIMSTDGKKYPLLRMDWVQGDTLYDWVRERCLKGEGPALADAARRWVELIAELNSNQIAHGDLQHANVMVAPTGELKLVDYDCMCVPVLAGTHNLEIGVEPYQHPQRDETTRLSSRLDDFSALFILVVLRALAAAPGLWRKYVEQAGQEPYEKILIRRRDLEDPASSSLRKDLLALPDPELRELTVQLWECFGKPIDQVPPLSEVLNSFREIEERLQQRDWDGAVVLISKKTPAQLAKATQKLQTSMRNAQARVQCRKALEEAVERGDEAAMAKIYDPQLIDDYPRAQAAARQARLASQVLPHLPHLQQLLQRKEVRPFVAYWDTHQALLSGRRSTQLLQEAARQWRQRNQACDTLLGLLRRPNLDEQAAAAAWCQLEALSGHPEAEPERPAMLKLLARLEALANWQQVPRTLDETTDQQLLQCWKESVFQGWPPAEGERPRATAALQRLDVLAQLHVLDQQSQAGLTLATEQKLLDLARPLPAGYRHAFQQRLEQAQQRLQFVQELQTLVTTGATEAQILAIWGKLGPLRGQGLVPPGLMNQIRIAEKRQPAWEQFQRVPALPNEENDRALCAAWRADLFDGWMVAEQHRPRVLQARQRLDLLARMRQGSSATPTAEGEQALVGLARQLPADYGHSLQARVAQAQQRLEAVRQLVQAFSGTVSDLEGARAWKRLEKADGTMLVTSSSLPLIQRAVRRAPLILALMKLPKNATLDVLDQRLLEIWRPELLQDCADVEPWRPAYVAAVQRRKLLKQLTGALQANDDLTVALLAGHALLKGYRLSAELDAPVRKARQRSQAAQQLLETLKNKDRAAFLKHFDAAMVRQYTRFFQPHQKQLEAWIRSEVAVLDKLGLSSPLFGAPALIPVPGTETCQVRWRWPEPRFAGSCEILVLRGTPSRDKTPSQLESQFHEMLTRRAWEDSGGCLLLHLESALANGVVAVWAVIDVGFATFYSEPLVLGRLPPPKLSRPSIW